MHALVHRPVATNRIKISQTGKFDLKVYLLRPYLGNVVISPHYYPPSISTNTAKNAAAPLQPHALLRSCICRTVTVVQAGQSSYAVEVPHCTSRDVVASHPLWGPNEVPGLAGAHVSTCCSSA